MSKQTREHFKAIFLGLQLEKLPILQLYIFNPAILQRKTMQLDYSKNLFHVSFRISCPYEKKLMFVDPNNIVCE